MNDVSDPVALLSALIRCPSVTPDDAGALTVVEEAATSLGFSCSRPSFSQEGTPSIENLYARLGSDGPHLTFAGHTDVVPTGDPAQWTHPPFEAIVRDGLLYGRGAVDMKGGIACFIAATARFLAGRSDWQKTGNGSISLLITGDEEGPAINGTEKLLGWAAERGEMFDAAIVGEPTNPKAVGDAIKIGRRGSLTGVLTVRGRQGHVAYPDLADNPLPALVSLCQALASAGLDDGTSAFEPSNLEITSIDTGNGATNVVPGQASAVFNIRFNDRWTPETLQDEIVRRLDRAGQEFAARTTRKNPVSYHIAWKDRPSAAFLTRDDTLISTMAGAVSRVTGRTPDLSTAGGTSDARFIRTVCPVVEFGLVGRTMHMTDENVALADLETLTAIYTVFLHAFFKAD